MLPLHRSLLTAAWLLSACAAGMAQTADATLFRNVRVYDGKNARLSAPSQVLVRGEVIERISATSMEAPAGATVIDGQSRTLMPRLIDNH